MNSSKSQSFFGIRKLPARYAGVVMPFILSVLMTCVVSMISTFRSVGWGATSSRYGPAPGRFPGSSHFPFCCRCCRWCAG